MATTSTDQADLQALDVSWDLQSLLGGAPDVDDLLTQAETVATELERFRGRMEQLDSGELVELMEGLAQVHDLLGRAGQFGALSYSVDTQHAENAAMMQRVEEGSTAIGSKLVFVDLEFAALDDETADALLADDRLSFCRHHLQKTRHARPHLLEEGQEKVLIETSVTGASAWVRLFSELTSAITVEINDDGETRTASLEEGLSLLGHPDREVRKAAAGSVSEGLASGLRTRAFIYNTLLLDKAVNDRLRSFPSWLSSRNLANEASDESVEALVSAVVKRYDIPRRWYRLKAEAIGVDRLADYDRMAGLDDSAKQIGWAEATGVVRDAYRSFSDELADTVDRFIDENWIDAPIRPGKQPGAFCAPGVPSGHPFILLNWTGRSRDVLTLAHELGHGVHGYLAREQGVFHQNTPLTVAETASVFGETVTNNRLLAMLDDPGEQFALLASTVDDSMATVFRQVAMNRFENACHQERREVGELSVDRFGELWIETQTDMMGDSVELSDNYATWWSYIPHFIGSPGYVYAYAYGQLLALSVYARYEEEGDDFVPAYLDLLRAGGSMKPEDLGAIVSCDLTDPAFWDSGLAIIENQIGRAEAAGREAGRLG